MSPPSGPRWLTLALLALGCLAAGAGAVSAIVCTTAQIEQCTADFTACEFSPFIVSAASTGSAAVGSLARPCMPGCAVGQTEAWALNSLHAGPPQRTPLHSPLPTPLGTTPSQHCHNIA
jgi:hypothetical protein